MKKGKIRSSISYIWKLIGEVGKDQVALYAAQASFFVIISAVPFISLMLSIATLVIPTDFWGAFSSITIPPDLRGLAKSAIGGLRDAPNVSLLSISAIFTFYTVCQGVAAVESGLVRIYESKKKRGIIKTLVRIIVGTVLSVVGSVFVIAVLLFGEFIFKITGLEFFTRAYMVFRYPLSFIVLVVVFCGIYSYAARGGVVPSKPKHHMMGSVFAALGFVVFSYFYSLYIKYFPTATYIYGGLGAVCLLMVWLYCCMIIFFLGAEINKLHYQKQMISDKR